jgi:predicted metal-dependent hydrolase
MSKIFTLPSGEQVTVRKSHRAKRMILKIDHSGQPIITIPKIIPYYAGLQFAKAQQKWIRKNTKKQSTMILRDGDTIGRYHSIKFQHTDIAHPKSYVRGNLITVSIPRADSFETSTVQNEAIKAATRAIKKEADEYLPHVLHQIAQKNGYRYNSVHVKNMRSRWGSCSSEKVINLSIWLMQLPDELIEYVCCHELTHLNHQHHQVAFWNELTEMIPDWKLRRKRLKEYRPSLIVDR